MEVNNGRLGGTTEMAFSIPDQGEYRLALPLFSNKNRAAHDHGSCRGRRPEGCERRSVTVQEAMIPASVSGYLSLSGSSASVTIPVPAGAKGGASLSVTPVGGLEHLVAPSLRYLVEYPYGCVEQTLSSFVPNVLAADLVKRGLMPPLE